MKVELLYSTPLWVCSRAIRKCWASEDKSDTKAVSMFGTDVLFTGEADKELIERVGNKNKHSSTLEHLTYTFDIDGISRACLQELARHRHASLSVKSTRYTLKELKEAGNDTLWAKYIVLVPNQPEVNNASVSAMYNLIDILKQSKSNDVAKYALPESLKTSLVWTINARSLQNFLALRTSKAALWEIRELAKEIFEHLPGDHKYLFEEFINE